MFDNIYHLLPLRCLSEAQLQKKTLMLIDFGKEHKNIV
jgi:hypothetical protein